MTKVLFRKWEEGDIIALFPDVQLLAFRRGDPDWIAAQQTKNKP